MKVQSLTFTGNNTFTEVDDNADGFFEALRATVEVQTTTAGAHSVFGILRKGGVDIANQPAFESMLFTGATFDDAAGTYTVDLDFSGEQIFRSGEDGPYDLFVYSVDPNNDSAQGTFATPAVFHTDYGEVAAVLTGFTDTAIDTDTDGDFDLVRVSVEVTVRVGGTFSLQGDLSGGGGSLAGAGTTVTLAPGTNTVDLEFSGSALRRSGEDGPYDGTVTLIDDASHTLQSLTFATQPYTSGTFGALLNLDGSVNDQGIDTNSNSLFDILRVSFGADVQADGTYLVSGQLTGPGGGFVAFTDEEMTLAAGAQTITLDFVGPVIREQGVDGPYDVEVVVREPGTFSELDRVPLGTQTAAYNATDFDPFAVTDILLTGNSSDFGVDTNANGLFDELRVEVEVALTTPGFYQWSARLVDANGTEIDFDARSGSLSAGTNTILFVFDGESIGLNAVDGPYFVKGLLMFTNAGPNTVVTDVAETGFYRFFDFEGGVQPVTLSVASEEPDAGVEVGVDPADLNGDADGTTAFARTFQLGETVTLTALATAPNGYVFLEWQVDGIVASADPALTITVEEDQTATVRYTVPLPHPFALLADKKIQVSSAIDADGAMHSNDKVDIKKGNPSTYLGSITAVGKVKIDKDNTIDGDITAGDEVDLDKDVTVTGTVTENASVASIPLPSLAFAAGGEKVTVPKNETMTLPPGSYDEVKVEAGGTLLLTHDGTGGDYFFEKLDLKKNATLTADVTTGPVTVNVVKKIDFKKETLVDVTASNDHGSRYLTFNSLEGDIDVHDAARVRGSLITPEGKVKLHKEVLYQGAICAEDIDIDKDVVFYSHTSANTLPESAVLAAPKTGAPEALADEAPDAFVLEGNYPNPFNPATTIRLSVPETAVVRLTVYDVLGRQVRVLVDGAMPAGTHEVAFEASSLPSGTYFYRLETPQGSFVKTMQLIK